MTTKLQMILRRQQRRNTFPVLQALAAVLAVMAVVCFAFKYHYTSPDQKTQNTVLSIISENGNQKFFQQLDLRDPSLLYDSDIMSTNLLTVRDRRAGFTVNIAGADRLPAIKANRFRQLAPAAFPAAPRLGVSPDKLRAPAAAIPSAVVISHRGEIINMPLLAKLNHAGTPETDSVIAVRRSKNGSFFRVMRSCGVNELDNAAGRELIRRTDTAGVYTVVWREKRVKK